MSHASSARYPSALFRTAILIRTAFLTAALAALGILAGVSLAFQAVLNTQLRVHVGTPLRSSFVSYIGGTLCCVALLLATRQSLNVFHPALRSSWWLWTGGLYGLVYIAIAVALIPRLGSAPVLALIVAGQMFAALLFDHVGLFGTQVRSVDAYKVCGAILLVLGVVLIRR